MKDLQKNLNKFVTQKFLSYGLHLGSLKLKWNPEYKPFLASFRHKLCLINLDYTLCFLKPALKFLCKTIISNKRILFIGSPLGLEKEFASLCKKNNHYFIERALYGFFSDYKKKYYLESRLSSKIVKPPAIIVIFDPLSNYMALDELKFLDIPIIAFVNSDEDFSLVDYPVPANIRSQKGGLFVYNLFHHLFLIKNRERMYKVKNLKQYKLKIKLKVDSTNPYRTRLVSFFIPEIP